MLRTVDDAAARSLWQERVDKINWELFDRGVEAYTWLALEEVAKAAKNADLLDDAPHGAATPSASPRQAVQAQLGEGPRRRRHFARSSPLQEELEKPFAAGCLPLAARRAGPKGDLVDDEMGRVLQVPGWSNIFTQPIINRIEMLSTGVRTDIGVKVFGPDLDTIDRVCKEIEAVAQADQRARAT